MDIQKAKSLFINIENNLRDYQKNLKIEHYNLKKEDMKKIILEFSINEMDNQIKFINNLIKEIN